MQFGQLLDNGHYYFVAAVIRALFFDIYQDIPSSINIKRITLVDNKLDKDKSNELLMLFEGLIVNSLKDEYKDKSVEYSEIKKDDLYNVMIGSPAYKAFKNNVYKHVFSPKDLKELEKNRY